MTVLQLIQQLQKLDPNADITFLDKEESDIANPIFKPYYSEEFSYITNVVKGYHNYYYHIPEGLEVADYSPEFVKNIVVLFDR